MLTKTRRRSRGGSRAGDHSVAFAPSAVRVYGYPLDEAAEVSRSAVRAWLSTHRNGGIEDILWVLRRQDVMAAFRGAPNAPTPGS